MRPVDGGAQRPLAVLLFLAQSHPPFSGEGNPDSPVAAQVERTESSRLPRLRQRLTSGTHVSGAMPGQVCWDSGTLHGKGLVMPLPGIPVVSQGGASGRLGLRAVSAIHPAVRL